MTTPTDVRVPVLIEAHDTLKAMRGYFVSKEVFIKGIAAADRRDRTGVDDAISWLTKWSDCYVHRASHRDTTRNLEVATTLARAARIVWCVYAHLPATSRERARIKAAADSPLIVLAGLR
jgi:hypothetical protein